MTHVSDGHSSEELAPRGELLADHASDRDHGKPAVVELLCLHRRELRWVGWLEAERIEAVVASDVVLSYGPALHVGVLEGKDRADLCHGDRKDNSRPEGLQRRLLEGDVRRHVDVAAEKRMELLGDREAERGEHGDATVFELDLAVEAHLALGGLAFRAAGG